MKNKSGTKEQGRDAETSPNFSGKNSQDTTDDNTSKSEREELEKRKQRTHKASTTPDKDHIG